MYVCSVALPLSILVCAIAALAQSPADSGDVNLEGRTIVSIVSDPAEQPLLPAEFDQRLGLHIGDRLSLADVRTAIGSLYATGRYHDIAVEGQPSGAGVELRIVTEFNYFVSGVDIEGAVDPPNREQLRTATKFELGGLFTENQMEPAVSNLLERLHANGLYHAQVSYHVDFSAGTQEAGIYFDIVPGQRARFDGINLTGTLILPPATVARKTGWRRGLLFLPLPGWRELTEQRLQNGIGKVEASVQKGDHLAARVTLEGLNYNAGANLVTPSLQIDSGPELEVNVTGAKISTSRLRQLIPIYEERAVDRSLLLEGQRNLTEFFQSKGYFEAQVEFEQSQAEPDRSVIDYSIVRGLRSKLVNIEIAGNRYFDDASVRERLLMTPARFLRYPWGHFSQRLLDQDTNTILDMYRTNGFRDAQVVSSRDDQYKGKPGELSVTLAVEEGPQWLIHNLDLQGVLPADEAHLRSILRSTAGQPYSEANIAADRDTILNYYFNNGYLNAAFNWTQTAAPQPTQVDLHFVVQPGKQEFVRNIFVRGLVYTKPSLVAHRITLAPKEPLSQARISESQQMLYDLGIFSKVQTAIQNPDGDEDSKNVLYHLDEASKYSFNAGFGAELARIGGGVTTFDAPAGKTAFSPRVSVGVSRLNFLGLAHVVSLQTLVSTLERRAGLTYQAPQFLGRQNLSLTFSGLFDDSSSVRTFTSHRLEGSVQLAQKLSRANSIQYRYTFRRVTIPAGTLEISPELVPIFSAPDRAGLVSISFIQDRRDDPIDSHRGYVNTLDLAGAWKGFGSATDYRRLILRNSSYHRIGRDLVLARSTQFGWIDGLGAAQIPFAEEFFSGGASTNRAFPDNQAGPRDPDTGFPIGGNAFLFNNTELRFPLIGDNVGGVLFHDIGNVYSDIDRISFRFRQRNDQDFNYAVNSFGFGIRYRTPVGPIRVDFSFSPDSPRFFGFSGTRDQLLNGTGTLINQRISVFQFHFSLGQTF
jgi:outer membrane protein assembly complex protein YaeT